MTKRQTTAMQKRLLKIEKKLATKRDEVRALLSDYESIVDSFTEGTDAIEGVLHHLRAARDELEGAADSMSQYV